MLSHIRNSTAARNRYEAATNDVFKVTFHPPALVQSDPLIITEHVKSVSGIVERCCDVIEQSFMQSKMKRASQGNSDTSQEVTIDFSRFLDKSIVDYVYEFWTEWRNLVYDPNTGTGNLAAEYMGSVTVEGAIRNRDVWVKLELKNFFPFGDLAGVFDFDYETADAQNLSVTGVAEDMKKQTRRLSDLTSLV